MAASFVINNIKLNNFRNYDQLDRKFDAGTNKIIGPNATGKTNIIEAISLLTQISSFRNSKIVDYINKNSDADRAHAEIEIFDKNTKTKNTIELDITDGKKTYTFNGKKKFIADIKGRFPSVVFTPDHLNLVKGSNTVRRNAVDNLGGQLSSDYYTVAKDYAKALKQKNAVLKENASKDMVKSLNEVMTIVGAQLVFYRLGLVKKLLPIVQNFYQQIASDNESLNMLYYPSWSMDDNITDITRDEARSILEKSYEDKLQDEIQAKKCIIGPHRDCIVFYLNDTDAQSFASQGQQRSIVLAFKLSEVELIENILDKRPVLLLDDVMSELDNNRQQKLEIFVKDKTQVFITSTS